MAFFNKYPYTDFHELNLDWILSTIKLIGDKVDNFITLNSIKYADPLAWDITTQYQANTVVADPNNHIAYLSVQPVPAGVLLTDTNYWTGIMDLSGFYAAIGDLDQLETAAKDNLVNAINEVYTTLSYKLDYVVTPEMFGALGDGVNDDGPAIQEAIDTGKTVHFNSAAKYLVSNTIIIPSKTRLEFESTTIIADTGSDPLFKTIVNNGEGSSRISIHGIDAKVTGVCSSVFEFNGDSDFSMSPINYARDIAIDHIHASSNDITNFILMNTAVRDVFISRCTAYTNNGIISDGKCVEIMVDSCLIYINTAGKTFEIASSLSGFGYNEGWAILNCTIDGTGHQSELTVSDIYSFQIANCYIGSDIKFEIPRASTHTRDLIINGNVINADIQFSEAGDAVTQAYHGNVIGNNIQGTLTINRGAYITISNNKFEAASSSTYAIIIRDHARQIVIEGNSISDAYAGGIISQYTDVLKSSIHSNNYYGTGYGININSPIEVHNNVGGSNTQNIRQAISTGTYAVGDAMATVAVQLGIGQKGLLIGQVNLSAPADANEIIALSIPTGINVPSGSGWTSEIIKCGSEQYVNFAIPYWTTDDVSGNVLLKNYAGDSVTVTNHSWIAVTR